VSADNRRTVAGYELCARGYTEAVAGPPSGNGEVALRRMVELVPAGGTVIEIGSGPGWDADFVESLGVTVRRSDVTRAFVDIQAERGKRAELLDVLHDDIGGPYDAVMALFVLQHIGRDLVDSVLHKVAAALREDGPFVVSLKEGEGELWEHTESSGDYHIVMWTEAEFTARLADAALRVEWYASNVDDDGTWMTLLAQREA